MKRRFYLFFAGLLFLGSCSKNYVEPKPVIPAPTVPAGYEISFSGRILLMFVAGNCSSCHDGGATTPDLREASLPAALFVLAQTGVPVDTTAAAESTLLYQKVKSGGSMNTYLANPSDADSILTWISQGAKNN